VTIDSVTSFHPVYERTRARRRPQVCAVATHHQSSALPRHGRPGSASRLPVSRYSQAVESGLRLTIITASKPLSVEELGLDCIRWMGQLQRSSWRTLMTRCSAEFRTPPTTFYSHELLSHPNTHHELRPRRYHLSLTSHWDQRNVIPETLYWAAGLVPSGIYNRKGTLNRSLVDILHALLLFRLNRDA